MKMPGPAEVTVGRQTRGQGRYGLLELIRIEREEEVRMQFRELRGDVVQVLLAGGRRNALRPKRLA